VIGKVGSAVTDKVSVTITVGATSSCVQPSSTTAAVICAPANGSTVGSPVTLSARGGTGVTVLEGWVDGVKVAQANGSMLTGSVSLAAGPHHFTVFAHANGAITDKRVSYFTVH
jgi:hypothetical protein